jgi:hypothetical protein
VLAGSLAAISSFGAALSSCRSIARAAISFGVALRLHHCALGQSEAGFIPLKTQQKNVLRLVQRTLIFLIQKPPKLPYFEEN